MNQETTTPTKMSVHDLDRHRGLQVYFIGPTDHRGARVCIKDLRRGDRVVLPYSYEHGDILQQAYEYLQAKFEWSVDHGFTADFNVVLADTTKGYILSTTDFNTSIK